MTYRYLKITSNQQISQRLDPISESISNSLDDITYIRKEINKMQQKDDTIRSMIGLPLINEDVRKMGTGGNNNSSEDLNYFYPNELEYDVLSYIEDINYLKKVIGMQRISYRDIFNHVVKFIRYFF